jgi:hypothetical protein
MEKYTEQEASLIKALWNDTIKFCGFEGSKVKKGTDEYNVVHMIFSKKKDGALWALRFLSKENVK